MWTEAGRSGKTAWVPVTLNSFQGLRFQLHTIEANPYQEMPKQVRHDILAEVKKIGIKYCGGCNPGYERVEMTERVQFRFSDRFFFLRHDEPDLDVMILMSGCHRACAGENLNTTKIPHCSVTGENDFDNLINWLKLLDQGGDF